MAGSKLGLYDSSLLIPSLANYSNSLLYIRHKVMSKVTKKVEKWLVSVIQPQYYYKDVTYSHIYHFLVKYLPLGFKIRTAVYTSDLGRTQLLINLHGNLQTQVDSFGISIWIPHNYPYADHSYRSGEPNGVPIIYVVPIPGTSIRPGNNVDAQGKIYHPYLTQWHSNMVQDVRTNEFLLIQLIDVLTVTFGQASPVGPQVISQGPELPPKPTNSRILQEPSLQREYSGPSLPAKPRIPTLPVDSTPARYRTPLPLPNHLDSVPINANTIEPQQSVNSGLAALSPQGTGQSANWNQGRSSSYSPVNSHIPNRPIDPKLNLLVSNRVSASSHDELHNRSSFMKPTENTLTVIEDLMDQISLDNGSSHDVNRDQLERLATQINKLLDHSDSTSIAGMIPQINEFSARLLNLHQQLEYHNNQARANEESLSSRVNYLQERVASIKALQTSLEHIEEQNSNSSDKLVVSSDRVLALDEIVTLDLIMLHQLYQVCTDIKAYKDAISLVGGTFKSEPEIINDSNLDNCVKAIRSVSRDLFWLEVTRQEIAKVMALENSYN